ncbi:contactin-associated protein-like 4 isoform X2 [Lingula anatina]|uniref:Contactin-associated protein-like 4 isoform X2 n=1 Tax=Lingula anatina TaxID=7574 RepID=A0A2R2MJW0_LINAN|nr:contactin-associated protein-like 4 isoform X2 [Lingula anatina]|eukprot:XP_023930347.1 contactin-associated protein-like 4 isoform X2 [Lingula anatina]
MTYRISQTKSGQVEITFRFRTWQSDALLLQQFLSVNGTLEESYNFALDLHRGHLRVSVDNGVDTQEITIGRGLQHNNWHFVTFTQSMSRKAVSVRLDEDEKIFNFTFPSIALMPSCDSLIYFGGMVTRHYKSFIGCLEVTSINNKTVTSSFLVTEKTNLANGCVNKCLGSSGPGPCLNGGECINRYTDTVCDCSSTRYAGKRCEKIGLTSVTMIGKSWLQYDAFEADNHYWTIRSIMLQFLPSRPTGLLFEAMGAIDSGSYLTVAMEDGKIKVIALHGGYISQLSVEQAVGFGVWHQLTVVPRTDHVVISLDRRQETLMLNSSDPGFHLTKVYIGGYPNASQVSGHYVNFTGCMRGVYVNHLSVLDEAESQGPGIEGFGFLLKSACKDLNLIPISFPAPSSTVAIPANSHKLINVHFAFKTLNANALLMHAPVSIDSATGTLKVWLSDGKLVVRITTDDHSVANRLTVGRRLNLNEYHDVRIRALYRQLTVHLDEENTKAQRAGDIKFTGYVHFGRDRHSEIKGSFVGCMTNFAIQNISIDSQDIVQYQNEGVMIEENGCSLEDHCANSNPCQHEGRCVSHWKSASCNCTRGYEGKTCQFAVYPSNCDEYYQRGDRISGVKQIDVDGTGSLSPSYVYCDMGSSNTGETVVDHNWEEQVVRAPGLPHQKMTISYRTMDMAKLQELVKNSAGCRQHFRYECTDSPIKLGELFNYSSPSGDMHSSLGGGHYGQCPCAVARNCTGTQPCNCDVGGKTVDKGFERRKSHLPVTDLVFKQNASSKGVAKFSLGPLICYGQASETFPATMSFNSPLSHLSLPGWTRGHLSFWFRTFQSSAVLFYQAPAKPGTQDFFEITLKDDTILFTFAIKSKTDVLNLKAKSSLTDGEWHYIAVELSPQQTRFTVDLHSQIHDFHIGSDGMLGPGFKGNVAIGHSIIATATTPGLFGCMRSLKYNNQLYTITDHVDQRAHRVIPGCIASCVSQPCHNEGQCVERWGDYQCRCHDPLLHIGRNCELDLSQDQVYFSPSASPLEFQHAMESTDSNLDTLFSFRTYQTSVPVYYAEDTLGNSIKVDVRRKNTLAFTLNRDREGEVDIPVLSEGTWIQVIIRRDQNNLIFEASGRQMVFKDDPASMEADMAGSGISANYPIELKVYIGGHPNSTQSLHGCFSGLKIGNMPYNLSKAADEGRQGILLGCESGCDATPCQHGGRCTERWQGQYHCDCSHTTYTGDNCDTDVGVEFDGNTVITTELEAEMVPVSEKESIFFTFATNTVTPSPMTLVFIQGSHGRGMEYILVTLTQQGTIRVDVDLGFGQHAIALQGHYADGNRHKVHFRRYQEIFLLQVDDRNTSSMLHLEYRFHGIRRISVGGITPGFIHFLPAGNMKGCISNVDIQLEHLKTNLLPLETALKISPGPEGVDFIISPNSADLRPAKCSPPPKEIVDKGNFTVFQEEIKPPSTFPPWNPGLPKVVVISSDDHDIHTGEQKEQGGDSTVTHTVVALVILLVAVAASVVITIILRRKHRKIVKEYHSVNQQDNFNPGTLELPENEVSPRPQSTHLASTEDLSDAISRESDSTKPKFEDEEGEKLLNDKTDFENPSNAGNDLDAIPMIDASDEDEPTPSAQFLPLGTDGLESTESITHPGGTGAETHQASTEDTSQNRDNAQAEPGFSTPSARPQSCQLTAV